MMAAKFERIRANVGAHRWHYGSVRHWAKGKCVTFWDYCNKVGCNMSPCDQGILTWGSASCRNFLTKCASECVMLNLSSKEIVILQFLTKNNVIFNFFYKTLNSIHKFIYFSIKCKLIFLLLKSPDLLLFLGQNWASQIKMCLMPTALQNTE